MKVESLVRTSALSSYRKPSVQRRGRAVEQADRHTGLEKYRLLWRLCSGSGWQRWSWCCFVICTRRAYGPAWGTTTPRYIG